MLGAFFKAHYIQVKKENQDECSLKTQAAVFFSYFSLLVLRQYLIM